MSVAEEGGALPFTFARRHGLVVTELHADHALIGYRPDARLEVLASLRARLDRPLRLVELSPEDFETALNRLYSGEGGAAAEVIDSLDQAGDLHDLALALPEPADLLEQADDAPIIRLINAILTEAVREGASDIHFEPFARTLRVRLRVDGVLREVLRPKAALAPLLVSRIKVMARLDIAEKRVPQDGRISLRVAGRPVDVRVSVLPSGHGERVVMRLLDQQAGRLSLTEIGFEPAERERLLSWIAEPHGIVLVTGPTGSGKTTTLYAALSHLNEASRNIMTVEDPIEYFLEGISQTTVNTKVDMSFARGLRAILRQDPDVVMVGEIRDLETARIAVQASLTGHLVLSTLHTNSAIGAVTRLVDMGIEPFLIASTLLATTAQRLVRRLCPACKRAELPDARERGLLGLDADAQMQIHHPVGCPACRHTGYRGRTAIYEMIGIDTRLRRMIHDGAPEADMARVAREQSLPLREAGLAKVRAGITTLDEVLRVSRQD